MCSSVRSRVESGRKIAVRLMGGAKGHARKPQPAGFGLKHLNIRLNATCFQMGFFR